MPTIKVPLRQEEFLKSEQFLWRVAQSEYYPDETKTLLNNRNIPIDQWMMVEKSSEIYKYSPFADEFGFLRVDGRTANAEFAPFDACFPIILPKQHSITSRILDHNHRKLGHAGKEMMLNELRQRFEVKYFRSAIDDVIKGCRWCNIKKCEPRIPRMAPLPEQRLMSHVRPFSYVGLDYMGPLEVSVGRRKEKRYVAVFTCMVVRAIHLEVAHSLSTD